MQPQSPMKSAMPKGGVDLDEVRAALTPVLAAHGVTLVELEWLTDRRGWTLRVIIERLGSTADAAGGVTLDDCVEVSRDVSRVLDVEDLIAHQYSLEVSSPGLDRKLHGAADFVRFRGQTAKVKLLRPAPDGQRVLRGPIEEAPEGRVAICADGKRIEVPAVDVEEARLVYELQIGKKKGTPRESHRRKAADRRERRAPR
jgi:ribosome maturation factor RimP